MVLLYTIHFIVYVHTRKN